MRRIDRTAGQETTAAPAARWTVADVIDLEALLARNLDGADDAGADDAGHPSIANAVRADDRRAAFVAWVELARTRADSALPGAIWQRGLRALRAVLVVVGFVLGAALAGRLLAHGDDEPVNALLFLGWTAGLQMVVLLMVTLAWIARAAGLRFGSLRDAMLFVLGAIGRAASHVDGAHRARVAAGWALVADRSGRLAPLVGCELLVVTQLFAIAFNVGLIAAMLLVYLPFEELRFGWQSTYSFTANGVAASVQGVAWPWRWISDELAPDAIQVAVTRYTRGQPASSLPAAEAHAWWPFLVSAIAFYGLTIRAALALAAAATLRHRLGRLRFTHAAANARWRRFEGPLFRNDPNRELLPDPAQAAVAGTSADIDVLIVDRHLWPRRLEIERALLHPPKRTVAADFDDDALPHDLLDALDARASVVLVTDATRDPIVAVAGFLATLSAKVGTVHIALVRDPAASDADTTIADRTTHWRRFLAIHRLPIAVETVR